MTLEIDANYLSLTWRRFQDARDYYNIRLALRWYWWRLPLAAFLSFSVAVVAGFWWCLRGLGKGLAAVPWLLVAKVAAFLLLFPWSLLYFVAKRAGIRLRAPTMPKAGAVASPVVAALACAALTAAFMAVGWSFMHDSSAGLLDSDSGWSTDADLPSWEERRADAAARALIQPASIERGSDPVVGWAVLILLVNAAFGAYVAVRSRQGEAGHALLTRWLPLAVAGVIYCAFGTPLDGYYGPFGYGRPLMDLWFFGAGLSMLALLGVIAAVAGAAGHRERKADAAQVLARYPYLASATNALGRRVAARFSKHLEYQSRPFSLDDGPSLRALHEALHHAAAYTRHIRGFKLQDAAGKALPIEFDPQHGFVIESEDHADGSRTAIVAGDVQLVLDARSRRNPRIRATHQGASYDIQTGGPEEIQRGWSLGLFHSHVSWLGMWECYRVIDLTNPKHWSRLRFKMRDGIDGWTPYLVPKLARVTIQQANRNPFAPPSTEKGGASFHWPKEWDQVEGFKNTAATAQRWVIMAADAVRVFVEQQAGVKVPAYEIIYDHYNFANPNWVGQCEHRPGLPWLIRIHSDKRSANEILATIAHELIHTLPGCMGHGPAFQNVAVRLGFAAPFDTYHSTPKLAEWTNALLRKLPHPPAPIVSNR